MRRMLHHQGVVVIGLLLIKPSIVVLENGHKIVVNDFRDIRFRDLKHLSAG